MPNESIKVLSATPPAAYQPREVELFTDETAGQYLGLESRTIRAFRLSRGLPFLRVTAKTIRIRRSDLDRWLDRQKTSITRGGA
jgi:excisionase family DNA binding protein